MKLMKLLLFIFLLIFTSPIIASAETFYTEEYFLSTPFGSANRNIIILEKTTSLEIIIDIEHDSVYGLYTYPTDVYGDQYHNPWSRNSSKLVFEIKILESTTYNTKIDKGSYYSQISLLGSFLEFGQDKITITVSSKTTNTAILGNSTPNVIVSMFSLLIIRSRLKGRKITH